jgi:hypothetical protein
VSRKENRHKKTGGGQRASRQEKDSEILEEKAERERLFYKQQIIVEGCTNAEGKEAEERNVKKRRGRNRREIEEQKVPRNFAGWCLFTNLFQF